MSSREPQMSQSNHRLKRPRANKHALVFLHVTQSSGLHVTQGSCLHVTQSSCLHVTQYSCLHVTQGRSMLPSKERRMPVESTHSDIPTGWPTGHTTHLGGACALLPQIVIILSILRRYFYVYHTCTHGCMNGVIRLMMAFVCRVLLTIIITITITTIFTITYTTTITITHHPSPSPPPSL